MAKVVVLDSGLAKSCKLSKEMSFDGGLAFIQENGKVRIKSDEYDDIGHGTAVASLIKLLNDDIDIIPIKIVTNGYIETTSTLIECMKYIYHNIECDVINISAGIVCCQDIKELRYWCKKIIDKGIFIVAAYDNLGAISYPAEIECVIGVSGERFLGKGVKYKKIKGTNNYHCKVKERILPGLDNEMQTVSGASFIAPEFSAKIAKYIDRGISNFEDVINLLDQQASGQLELMEDIGQEMNLDIKKAIVFPFNKEMHSLARYSDLLKFEICGLYDTKYSGNVGRSIKELQDINDDNIYVEDINKLDWNSDFDTVILGHTSIMADAIGKDYEKIIIEKCLHFGKKLFSCRDIRSRNGIDLGNLDFYVPKVDSFDMKDIVKMNVIGVPIVGVVGTGGSQGKFSIQLGIRRELLRKGYKVGQIGTEPTAQLFGIDYVFPCGHESAVYTKGFESVVAINNMLGNIQKNEPDIILFGNQANTVPYQVGGPQDYPIVQHEVILGCQADAYILCISDDASDEYIVRTINYLQSVYKSKVIAIVISNLSIGSRWSNYSNKKEYLTKTETEMLTNRISRLSTVPIVNMNDNKLCEKLTDIIIEYFGE